MTRKPDPIANADNANPEPAAQAAQHGRHGHDDESLYRAPQEAGAGLNDTEPDHFDDEQNAEASNARNAPNAQNAPNGPADPTGANAPANDLASLPAEALLERLNEATAETARASDQLLRAKAEVENIRRRSHNEIVAARKFAIEGFARELLGVRDSLEQAATVELDEDAVEAQRQMKEGIGLTLKQLDLALDRFSVAEVEAAPGARFDPERHQAISTAPSGEIEADHIVTVVQKGFLLKERLLRPAMVVVAKA